MARAYDQATPGGIEDAWRERMKEALKDLEGDLRGEGAVVRGEGAVARGADAGAD
jgi:hypothetical protein